MLIHSRKRNTNKNTEVEFFFTHSVWKNSKVAQYLMFSINLYDSPRGWFDNINKSIYPLSINFTSRNLSKRWPFMSAKWPMYKSTHCGTDSNSKRLETTQKITNRALANNITAHPCNGLLCRCKFIKEKGLLYITEMLKSPRYSKWKKKDAEEFVLYAMCVKEREKIKLCIYLYLYLHKTTLEGYI